MFRVRITHVDRVVFFVLIDEKHRLLFNSYLTLFSLIKLLQWEKS